MSAPVCCPRCGGEVHPPDLWSSSWRCGRHGAVLPLHVPRTPGPGALTHLIEQARVPVWLPHPLPVDWVVTGVAFAGDDRTGGRATALAAGGASPLGGPAELVIVAEEPGIGLGARLAGLPEVDPGDVAVGSPEEKVLAAGHPTPLWCARDDGERVAYVGEARGVWLWLVLWPASAGLLLSEHIVLADLRDGVLTADEVPFGAPTARLGPPPTG